MHFNNLGVQTVSILVNLHKLLCALNYAIEIGTALCQMFDVWYLVFVAATPKQIRELMKVDGLTNDEVKSHLQVCVVCVTNLVILISCPISMILHIFPFWCCAKIESEKWLLSKVGLSYLFLFR